MRRLGFSVGLAAALLMISWAATVYAQGFRSGNDITVSKGQTVNRSLFAFGRAVDVAGTVNGDLFCAGQDITVTGKVTGDVVCAGQNVNILGTVEGNVRVGGQDVTIGSTVGRNLTIGGQNVTLEQESKIGGDATVGAAMAIVNGSIGRDLVLGATSSTLNSSVGRDVRSEVDNLTLGSSAFIGGNLDYTSARVLSRDNGAEVVGKITHKQPKEHPTTYGAFLRGGVWFALYLFVALFILALLLVSLLPQMFHSATKVAVESPGKTFLVGLGASILVPITIATAMITVIGIPVGLLVLLLWLVAMALAGPFAAYYAGRLILRRSMNAVAIMATGSFVLLVLYFVPIVGAIVSLVALWFGLGIILLQVGRISKPRYGVTYSVASKG